MCGGGGHSLLVLASPTHSPDPCCRLLEHIPSCHDASRPPDHLPKTMIACDMHGVDCEYGFNEPKMDALPHPSRADVGACSLSGDALPV